MFDKNKYYQQVEQILQFKSLNIEDFRKLYDIAISNENCTYGAELADKIISCIFSNAVSKEIMIPWSFFNTDLGMVILKVKFGYSSMPYFISDLIKFTGYSKQYLAREANNENIKGVKKDGTWIFTSDSVEEYLLKKGITKASYAPSEEKIINPGFERESSYCPDDGKER